MEIQDNLIIRLNAGKIQLNAGEIQLNAGKIQLNAGKIQLNAGKISISCIMKGVIIKNGVDFTIKNGLHLGESNKKNQYKEEKSRYFKNSGACKHVRRCREKKFN